MRTGRKGKNMEINFANVGSRIQKIRKEKGISQEQLARAIGISKGHIGHVEAGSKNPSAEMLINIAVQLEVPVDVLLSDLDVPHSGEDRLQDLLGSCSPAARNIITEVSAVLRDLLGKYGI